MHNLSMFVYLLDPLAYWQPGSGAQTEAQDRVQSRLTFVACNAKHSYFELFLDISFFLHDVVA